MNTNTFLHWFVDVEVENHDQNSAVAYGKNTNYNTALNERIFPFKIYWQEFQSCKL